MSSRVFVGNLPSYITERDLDDLFYKYGRITEISLKKVSRPPLFAFINFANPRDARDAVYDRDGYSYDGNRIRVELAKGDRREERRDNRGRDGYVVNVSSLPFGCSWQELKDFGRKGGEVIRSDVFSRGEGILEFKSKSAAEDAIKTLDGTELKTSKDSSVVKLKLKSNRSRSPYRSRSRSPRRRYSYSRSRSRSRSYSRSKSPRDHKADHSRSRSRSPRSRSRSPRSRSRSRSPSPKSPENKEE